MEELLALSGVGVTFPGGVHAVDRVDLDVRAGEIVALAGLVGSGRSEVAQSIFGVDPRDSGTVEVAGKVLRPSSPKQAMAAGVALVPEDRRQQGLVMELSIERNVTLPRSRSLSRLGFLTGGRERRSAREWTERLKTKYGRLSDEVGTLSGGNQQRVNIAIGLLRSPAALLLDEPSAALDPRQRERLWSFIGGLAAEGTAVVYSTHDVGEAERYASRVMVLADGELLFHGTPKELERVVGGDAKDFETAFVRFLHDRGH